MTRPIRARALGAAFLAGTLLIAACGDDDDTATGVDDGGEPTALTLTLDDDGLTGLPDSFAGGAVEVTLTLEGTREFASVDFSKVDDGTTAEQFAEDILTVFEGNPFPEYVRNGAGVEAVQGAATTSTILLEPGTHVVWHDGAPGEDEDAPPEIIATVVEVTSGGGDLPDGDGTITARDYGFDVDVSGPGTLVFRNDGPVQFHHAVLMDFGTNEPAAVEAALPALMESEGEGPPPDGIDMEQVDFEFGGSAVFGPGLGGTFEADVVEGNTYAVVCFISDRSGGPPHVFAHDMFEVFTAG